MTKEIAGLEAEKYQPKIEFVVDKQRDIDISMSFWRRFRSARHKGFQQIEEMDDEDEVRKIVEDFLNSQYEKHAGEIEAASKNAKEDWREIEPEFFAKVEKLFPGFPWPKGNYRGEASILNRFPRNIKAKRFSFPANDPKFSRAVIAHEMLHFIAYDYLQTKFGLTPSEHGDEDNTFWQFTENLNVLIENEPDWQIFTYGRTSRPYPECR